MTVNFGLWTALVVMVVCIILIVSITVWLDKQPDQAWNRWYARINAFPTSKALVVFAMSIFFITGLVVAVDSIYFGVTSRTPTDTFIRVLDTWLDKVLILSGISTIHFIGKRATTKPELEDGNHVEVSAGRDQRI